MNAQSERKPRGYIGLVELWLTVLVAPFVWWLHLEAQYALVPFACTRQWRFLMHVVSLVALLIAASGSLIAWRNWQRIGPDWPGDEPGVQKRDAFLSVAGMLTSAFFFLAILAQAIATFVIGPCQNS